MYISYFVSEHSGKLSDFEPIFACIVLPARTSPNSLYQFQFLYLIFVFVLALFLHNFKVSWDGVQ